jgi:ABC-type bacteriocin/lantibiotic exporter with double-glycine peptidase domain
MILRYWGAHSALAQCRDAIGGGRDGITALMLANAARSWGLEVVAYRVAPAHLTTVPLPAIAHWQNNHFVVVEAWEKQVVRIIDPAVGRLRLTLDEWQDGFSGVVLTCSPTPAFSPSIPTVRERVMQSPGYEFFHRLWHIPAIPALLGQLLLASLLLHLLGLAMPLFTQQIVDRVLPQGMSDQMTLLGMGMVLFVVAHVVMDYLREVLALRLQTRIDAHMMLGFFAHLTTLPYSFFQERTSGDLLMRLESTTHLRETLTGKLVASILDGILVIGYIALLLLLAPPFGVLVLAVALLQAALLLITSRPLHYLSQRIMIARTDEESYLIEVLRGMMTVKTSGADVHVLEAWSQRFFASTRLALQRSQLATLTQAGVSLLALLLPLILLWVGTQAVLQGMMTVGTMLGLTLLAAACLAPLSALISTIPQFQMVRAQLERLMDVLQTASEQPHPPPTNELAPLQGQLDVYNISFGYTPHCPPLLHDMTFSVAPGQKVVIVGRTGSGKTTLIQVLLGLLVPTSGEVRYDGILLQELDYRWVRQHIGVVPQETWLVTGSIRENIAFATSGVSLADVEAAARVAALHDVVAQLPMGYATPVVEGGGGVSGGMRQRIAIARAVVHRPRLLILDEATNHLDNETAAYIDSQLHQLGCTQLVITHRLSTARTADLILVLQDGGIVEQGTHEMLLQQGGVYARMVS